MTDLTQMHPSAAPGPAPAALATRGVSVVIPVYNRRKLLERAVESVREQTYPDWELLIVDDGSTDGTAEYAAELAAADPRVTCLRNTRGRGPGGARNSGITRARGQFVAFLDSDDSWLPEKLARQVDYFSAHPQAMAVGTDCFVGSMQDSARLANRHPRIDHAPEHVFATILARKQFWIYTPTVMLRRAIFETIPLFDESLIRCEDLVMWLTINQHFGWHYVAEPLSFINVNPARNADYSESRQVPEGYYHMLFVRDVERHVQPDAPMRKILRRQRRDPDYLFWRGRERLQKRDPTGLLYYAGALGARLLDRVMNR
jgi:glycosyltransferase involved in cell wall biosynthesis